MAGPNTTTIPLELPPNEAAAFSQFTKRLDYDTVGRFTAPTVSYAGRSEHDVAVDDVLDAFAALWTAGRIARGEASTLPISPLRDSQDLPMEIVY